MICSFDYVVVGVGLVGCVFVNWLFDGGCYMVCLLEVGFVDNYMWIYVLIGYGKMMFYLVYNWGFYIDFDLNMYNCCLYWLCGCMFGGCSLINGLIYVCG